MLQSSRLVLPSELSDAHRPIRLRLGRGPEVITDHLMVKRISGDAAMCGGFEYRLLCVAAQAGLPLKSFGALAAELQFVTDRGLIHSVCGIVARADEGESDGGLATYQLVIRDALALMESRVNTRVFRAASEVEITRIVLTEWTRNNPALACAFDFALPSTVYPAREFTMQYNESDAAFLRRLWKRRGLAWFFEAAEEDGDDGVRRQRLVVFDDARKLGQSSAGTVRYHRDDGTEERDSVTAWHACRKLSPGSVSRRSWDYKRAGAAEIAMPARLAQGDWGDRYAAGVEEYLVDSPHVSDDAADFDALAKRRVEFHEYAAKFFLGESGVRDLAVGRWVAMEGHPEISRHPPAEREFVITELHVEAENNLPQSLNDKIARLFALNRWPLSSQGLEHACAERDARYANNFRCVRRGVPIVPSFDPRVDVPRAQAESVVVVAPEGEVVHCDEWGRVKVRFPACRAADHSHAQAAGGPGGESDSAWIRVASTWAGDRLGVISLPRAGEECIVTFLGGDPDKPVITGRVHGPWLSTI
jgi:type VI secretion system secreted protein VgrG